MSARTEARAEGLEAFRAELWEDDEYVIVGLGGVLGMTLPKADAHAVARWLNQRGGFADLQAKLPALAALTAENERLRGALQAVERGQARVAQVEAAVREGATKHPAGVLQDTYLAFADECESIRRVLATPPTAPETRGEETP